MKINYNDIDALLKKYNKGRNYPATSADFERHAKRYIKAIKERRIICAIDKVSASGMSRTLKFLESSRGSYEGKTRYSLLNFYEFFCMMEYKPVNSQSDYFRIIGCGMDMVFATNYYIIGKLERLGFLNAKLSSELRQATPPVV